jgi:hypothetical protein
MSAIPPDIASAAAQAASTAREAARPRDADRLAQARAAEIQIRAATDAADQVGTSDGDTAVFTDAEGTGSQGRSPADEVEVTVAAEQDQAPDEAGGLDLQA